MLDFSPKYNGDGTRQALARTVERAQHAEALGYRRFWFTEHHNVPRLTNAAPPIVLAHVASRTRSIRVGSGGAMLPNYSPLLIAEQFGTLAALHPGRIDLESDAQRADQGRTLTRSGCYARRPMRACVLTLTSTNCWRSCASRNRAIVHMHLGAASMYPSGCWGLQRPRRQWRASSACRSPTGPISRPMI